MPSRRIRRSAVARYERAQAIAVEGTRRAAASAAASQANGALRAGARAPASHEQARSRVLAILEQASREQGGTDDPALDAVALAGLMAALNDGVSA